MRHRSPRAGSGKPPNRKSSKGNRHGNVGVKTGFTRNGSILTFASRRNRSTAKQEARVIKSVIKVVTLTVFFMALIAAPSVVPVFAAGGGGGGGGPPGEDLMRPA